MAGLLRSMRLSPAVHKCRRSMLGLRTLSSASSARQRGHRVLDFQREFRGTSGRPGVACLDGLRTLRGRSSLTPILSTRSSLVGLDLRLFCSNSDLTSSVASSEVPAAGGLDDDGSGSKSDDGEVRHLSLELMLPKQTCDQLLELGGLRLSLNGMQYGLDPRPMGKTGELIEQYQEDLERLHQEIAPLDAVKTQLDRAADTKTRRIIWASLAYLVAQSAVVFKLTFFSRFGWDVMEPICYFITFYTGIAGLIFFQFFRVDYTYPAAYSKLLKHRQEASYERNDFDFDRWKLLMSSIARKETQLKLLRVPRLQELENAHRSEQSGEVEGEQPSDWCTALDAKGTMYYYNPATGEVRTESPFA